MRTISPEQIEAEKKRKALKEAQDKYAAACVEYHNALAESEPADLKSLADYVPFAEQIVHSDASQASSAGLLARILRLEAKASLRDEPPTLEQ